MVDIMEKSFQLYIEGVKNYMWVRQEKAIDILSISPLITYLGDEVKNEVGKIRDMTDEEYLELDREVKERIRAF